MWPGRAKSSGRASAAISLRTVVARSAAEMPVVTSCTASTDTVNAVRCDSVLLLTMSGSCSASRRSPSIGMQMTPLVCRTKKPIASGVIFSAAMMRSPSFSRSSSSTTITISPFATAAMAFSMWVNMPRPL